MAAITSLATCLFHLPPNSFELNTFYQMEGMGGPSVVSIRCYCRAALFRAAFSIVKGWDAQLRALRDTAQDCLPLRLVCEDSLSPPCWDSPPIVLSLYNAYHGFGEGGVYSSATSAAKRLLNDSHRLLPLQPQFGPLRPQKTAYETFRSQTIPNNFEKLLMRRLPVLGCFDLASFDRLDLEPTLVVMRQLDKFVVSCWLKTVCNGWCTSSRLHEERRSTCIFGCSECKDELSHYLVCDVLLSITASHFSSSMGPTPLHRLNIISPSPQAPIMLCAMYNMYHTLKVGHRPVVDRSLRSSRFGPCCAIASSTACEISLQYRHLFAPTSASPHVQSAG